jgi:hypothetical protein
MLLPSNKIGQLLPEQDYLFQIQSLPMEPLTVSSLLTRIKFSRPRRVKFGMAKNLETLAAEMAISTFKFEKAMKRYCAAAVKLIVTADSASIFKKIIGQVISKYSKKNKRLLLHRNYIVKGENVDASEFSEFSLLEVYAHVEVKELVQLLPAVFFEYRSEWLELAKGLSASMEQAIQSILTIDRDLHTSGELKFGWRSTT